jgi:hypothetical protein
MSHLPITKSLAPARDSTEPALRDAGKWETARHYRFSMAPNSVQRPLLELRYLARHGGRLSSHAETIPFAVIVSVIDKSPDSQLHDRARAQFPVLKPLSQVRLPPESTVSQRRLCED